MAQQALVSPRPRVVNRWRCPRCLIVAPTSEFKLGDSRAAGRHPECRYCPDCGATMPTFPLYVVERQ